MQAELKVQAKPQSFYQRHILPTLRRLWRPQRQSVWDVDYMDDDRAEDYVPSQTENAGVAVGRVLVVGFMQALLILLPTAYIVQLVFVVPGGVIGMMGRQLADVCLSGGSCDIHQLLASYAFAIIFLLNAAGLILYGILAGLGYFDQPNADDVPLAIAVTDEHVLEVSGQLVELREELGAAHVLPPLPDDDDDPAD